jgi:uncharacterized protein
MPLFAILAFDRPDAGTLRADTRPRHLDHIRSLGDRVARAGPFDDEAGQPIGSLILAEFADLSAAQAFAAADPYAQAGLFAETRVLGWRQVFP